MRLSEYMCRAEGKNQINRVDEDECLSLVEGSVVMPRSALAMSMKAVVANPPIGIAKDGAFGIAMARRMQFFPWATDNIL